MFSQDLLEKWKKLLEEKYGLENPTQQEVFEFASKLTGFFELLTKFNHEDQFKNAENIRKSE